MTLLLRTNQPDGVSRGGFQWPHTVGAYIEAPDWNPEPKAGHGLHGFIEGTGNWSSMATEPPVVALPRVAT